MIPYKIFIQEKFKMKKIIKNILDELEHSDYYLNMNDNWEDEPAIHLQWFEEKAPIQIHEFRELFEDRFGDKYILEYNESDIHKIEYYIVKRNK